MDSSKRDATRILFENRGTLMGQSLMSLLSLLMDDARKKNDEATGEEVYRNQGEVRAYKQLLNILTKSIPTP